MRLPSIAIRTNARKKRNFELKYREAKYSLSSGEKLLRNVNFLSDFQKLFKNIFSGEGLSKLLAENY